MPNGKGAGTAGRPVVEEQLNNAAPRDLPKKVRPWRCGNRA